MRPDYQQHDALFPNNVQSPSKHPSLLVNDSGVFLLTCRDHGVKSISNIYIYQSIPQVGFAVHLLIVLLQLS